MQALLLLCMPVARLKQSITSVSVYAQLKRRACARFGIHTRILGNFLKMLAAPQRLPHTSQPPQVA
jgi:hypothetical protein